MSQDRFGDYEIVRRIGKGGMGEVFEARHVRMGLPVALKTIKAGESASEYDIERFLVEARAVATLHKHPNIVKIHTIDQRDGQHYIVMQLIRGGSLKTHLQGFGTEPRLAAQFMIKVADAITHAHRRGILHRDLKPDNILLDEAGTPYVTDFGLAKRVTPEPGSEMTAALADANEAGTRQANPSSPGLDSGSTQGGAILGTPSYMPPEQARGEIKNISTLSDVYSLGATLFAMLSGQPPFLGTTVRDVLDQVITEPPPSIRKLNPRVDADLEAVCQKALEKNPKGRYESAETFGRDLERWLEGRPVHARTIPGWKRALKWVRREPLKAAAIGLGTAVLVLAVISVEWKRGLDKAELIQSAQQAKITSQSVSLRTAGQAVKKFIEIVESEIGADVNQQKLREKMLKQAVDYYDKVIDEQRLNPVDDDETRLQLAKAHNRVAELTGKIGSNKYQYVIDHYKTAINILQSLHSTDSQSRSSDSDLIKKIGSELGSAYHEKGIIHSKLGQTDDALECYENGRKRREAICDPCIHHYNLRACGCMGDIVARAGLGRSHGYIGDIHLDAGRPNDAEKSYNLSQQIRKKLYDDIRLNPSETRSSLLEDAKSPEEIMSEAGLQLARSHGNLAWLARYRGDLESAVENEGTSINLLRNLLEKGSDDQQREVRADLASALRQLSRFYLEADLSVKALVSLEEAKKVGENLVKEKPGVAKYRIERANAEAVRAEALLVSKKLQGTHEVLKVVEDYISGTNDFQGETEHRQVRLYTNVIRAKVWLQQARPDLALPDLENARIVINGLIEADPSNAEFLSDRAEVYTLLAKAYHAKADDVGSRASLANALSDQNSAMNKAKGNEIRLFRKRLDEIVSQQQK